MNYIGGKKVPSSAFLHSSHMKTRSYHSHHTSDHENEGAGVQRPEPMHGNCHLKSDCRIGQCGSMTAWESYMSMIPANCMHTQWVVTQDSRSVICFWSSWMFLPSFSCLFLFLTCLTRQYVRSSSNQVTGHLSLDL